MKAGYKMVTCDACKRKRRFNEATKRADGWVVTDDDKHICPSCVWVVGFVAKNIIKT